MKAMKKTLLIIGIAVGILAAFLTGRLQGIRHAIDDCEMYITEFPEDNTYLHIYIDLDGNIYEHIGTIG